MSSMVVSRGVCIYCGGEFSGSGMSRHLQACQARKRANPSADNGADGDQKLYHLRISGLDLPEYWMHIEIPADALLYDLDDFLRAIWLECCGHLSMFRFEDQNYVSFPVDIDDWNWNFPQDKEMDVELGKILQPGMEFTHEYDFGSTTYLKLKVVGFRSDAFGVDKDVEIMARNNPPDIRCEICGKTAVELCVFCNYMTMCAECGEQHECGEQGWLPIVNSPRVGVCGYIGPEEM